MIHTMQSVRYPLTFVVNGFPLKEGQGGCTWFIFIFIKRKYAEDEGLYQHELTHIKQTFATCFLHALMYLLIRDYRLWAEVQAYRKQMEYGLTLDLAAYRLSLPLYDLNLTEAEAKEALTAE